MSERVTYVILALLAGCGPRHRRQALTTSDGRTYKPGLIS
jgi:hypothetical protein